MYITSLNPNTFSYLKRTKPIHMLCLISYKTSQHEFCNNEKNNCFCSETLCSTQLEITNTQYVESRFLYNFSFHPKDHHSMNIFFKLFKSPSRPHTPARTLSLSGLKSRVFKLSFLTKSTK